MIPEILRLVLKNFKSRFRLCLRNNDGHFKHLVRRPEWSSIVFFQKNSPILPLLDGVRTHARTRASMHARTHACTHARTHVRTKEINSIGQLSWIMLMPTVL